MSDCHSRLASQQSNSHDGKSNPRQPILACLAISIKECPDNLLKTGKSNIFTILFMCMNQNNYIKYLIFINTKVITGFAAAIEFSAEG